MEIPRIIELDDKKYVNSVEFHHKTLKLQKQQYVKNLNRWLDTEYLFSDNEIRTPSLSDFVYLGTISTGGRGTKNYLLSLELSKMIAINSDSKVKKYYVQWLLSLEKKHETGQAFTTEQIELLIDLSRSMILVSIQKKCEKKHYDLFNNPYKWYEHRAKVLGYSVSDLKDAMKKVNKIHKETRKSLMQLDSNELIRTGVIDFFLCLGKSEEYAVNVGNLCKKMAEKMELGNHIWDDTKDNPLGINFRVINSCNTIFENTMKSIEKL